MNSPQMANLMSKTAAAAEEFKRLLAAEQQWAEERAHFQSEIIKKDQEIEKQIAKIKRFEESRAVEMQALRKEREESNRDKEAASTRITALLRELDLKAQSEARFNLEKKSWAERIERLEKIKENAREDAESAGQEVARLQKAYQELFSKSRLEKEQLSRQIQVLEDDNTDMREKIETLQEQQKASSAQIEALDAAISEARRAINHLNSEKSELSQQMESMEHEIGDVLQQLHTAQNALEAEKEAHIAALEIERSERQRQQEFFGQALAEAEGESRSAHSQVHAMKLKIVQFERETKRLKDEKSFLQQKISNLEEAIAQERAEWEQTYQQMTEAIARKEMEQDAAAAHLEVMLRSVGGISKSGMDVGMSTVGLSKTADLSTEANALRSMKVHNLNDSGRVIEQDSAVESSTFPSHSPVGALTPQEHDWDAEGEEMPRSRPPSLSKRQSSSPISGERSKSKTPDMLPRYMQDQKRPDTGTTTGEVTQFWNVGLRADFYGVRDPVADAKSESEDRHLLRPGRTPLNMKDARDAKKAWY
uniref:Uncharacterized protein n=1 Tax=Guillardia theta TaxID=55529 RepID=A0A6U6DUR8_GUITH|mmetsp:Transcript_794/g.2404  ORF Transcript_794/g.2404 Transcript_794/m.2404 type:complete len:536 (+) Transcript_794:210-1817(+)